MSSGSRFRGIYYNSLGSENYIKLGLGGEKWGEREKLWEYLLPKTPPDGPQPRRSCCPAMWGSGTRLTPLLPQQVSVQQVSVLSIAVLSPQPLPASITELLAKHKQPTNLLHGQCAEALTVLQPTCCKMAHFRSRLHQPVLCGQLLGQSGTAANEPLSAPPVIPMPLQLT